VQSLESAVAAATNLYQLPRVELPIDYLDVLTAQNELFAAIRDLIEVKGEQLAAIVNTYQALGGGGYLLPIPPPQPPQYDHHWWKLVLSDIKDQANHWRHPGRKDAHRAPGGPIPPPRQPGEAPPNPDSAPVEGPEPQPPASPATEETPQPMPTPPSEMDSDSLPAPKAATSLEPLPPPAEAADRPGPLLTPSLLPSDQPVRDRSEERAVPDDGDGRK
jgi:hypothetical protein